MQGCQLIHRFQEASLVKQVFASSSFLSGANRQDRLLPSQEEKKEVEISTERKKEEIKVVEEEKKDSEAERKE